MPRLIFLLPLLLFSVTIAAQQEDYVKNPEGLWSRLEFHDFYYSAGAAYRTVQSEGFNDFIKLAPNSTLIDQNITNSDRSNINQFGNQAVINAGLTYKLLPKEGDVKKGETRFRIGLQASNGVILSASYNDETRTPIDTLSGSNPTLFVVVDSVYSRELVMSYNMRSFALDISVIRTTNPAKRWSLWAGAGLALGAVVQPNTFIEYYEAYSLESQTQSAAQLNFNAPISSEGRFEQFRNKSSLMTTLYIPFGINYRIGDRPFWAPFNFFFEYRPMLYIQGIPELETIATINQSVVAGLRYTF